MANIRLPEVPTFIVAAADVAAGIQARAYFFTNGLSHSHEGDLGTAALISFAVIATIAKLAEVVVDRTNRTTITPDQDNL